MFVTAPSNTPATVLTVFLSSPGDVRPEIDLADDVVRDLQACVQALGIFLRTWRYERNAPPGVGRDAQTVLAPFIPDYDLYVGVMCNRLGTPTLNAASGTLEEFQDACCRRELTGRPTIFFYFCAEDLCCGHPQSEAVRAVRASYPGLFREFRDAHQFAAILKQDMLLWLTHTVLTPRKLIRPAANPSWLARVRLSKTGRSEVRFARLVARLHDAFPLVEVLSAREEEVLLAAAFQLATGSSCSEWTADLAAAAALTATECREHLNASKSMTPTDDRTAVLASLLAIASLLERDRSGGFDEGQSPAADAQIEEWISFLTREIRVNKGGVVQYVLEVPATDCIDGLKSSSSLRLESLWQRLRIRLAPLKLAITVAPSEVVLAPPTRRVPEAVREYLRNTGAVTFRDVRSLDHLGDDPPVSLEVLVPLIRTRVIGKLAVRVESARRHLLALRRPGDPGAILSQEASVPGWIELDVAALEVDAEYEWALYAWRNGGPVLLRAGCVVIGNLAVGAMLGAVSSILPEQYRSLCRSLGMHDELLRQMWEDLRRDLSPSEDRVWAYERLIESYEFSRIHHPSLVQQVEAFRNAAVWLLSQQRSGEHR